MKEIIASCITGGITLIGFVINYFIQTKTDFTKAKEHRNVNMEKIIDSGKKNTSEILSTVSSVKEMMIEEKTANQYRYQNMNDAQKNISDSVRTLESFSKEMGQLILENKKLELTCQELKQEISRLKQQNQDLYYQNERLAQKFQDDIFQNPQQQRNMDDMER